MRMPFWPIADLIKNHYGPLSAELCAEYEALGPAQLAAPEFVCLGDLYLVRRDFTRSQHYYNKVNALPWATANYYDKMQAELGALICQDELPPPAPKIAQNAPAAALELITKLVSKKKKNLNNDSADKYKRGVLKIFNAAAPHVQEIYGTGSNAYYHQALSLLWHQAHQNYLKQEKAPFTDNYNKFNYLMRYTRNWVVKEQYKPVASYLQDLAAQLK